jgi:hypothetical protein
MEMEIPKGIIDVPPDQSAGLLEDVADCFESGRLAWIQHEIGDGVSTACLAGGMDYCANQLDAVQAWRVSVAAGWYLRRYIGDLSIARWNDVHGRTVGEVIDALKGTAKHIRNMPIPTGPPSPMKPAPEPMEPINPKPVEPPPAPKS